MIWLTSDLHFSHQRDFLYEPRGFESVQEMNKAIVENWNKVVQPNDDVYVLGDLMLNDNDEGTCLVKQLKGNIHIILGNHDTDSRIELYKTFWNVKSIEYATRLEYNGYHFFLSHYPTLCSNHDSDKPLKRRCISLCGHTHTPDCWADWDTGLIYHCELDAHHNTPVALDTIINDIEQKVAEDAIWRPKK